MASYRKRGAKWQVQIRRNTGPNLTKTFALKTDAELWARQMERELDRQALDHDPRKLEKVTFKELVERYRDEISVAKAGGEEERWLLNRFLKEPICQKRLSEIRPSDFASYRDRRLREVTPSTVNRQFAIIQHVFEIARLEWNVPIQGNPVASIRKPRNNPSRVRRLAPWEEDKLLEAAHKCRTNYLHPSIVLAIETGMRRGEILAIKPADLEGDLKRLSVPNSKTGHPRVIPLSKRAQRASESLLEAFINDCEQRCVSINAFRLNWQRTVRRSGIENLHFHDLRHEAISRFF